MNTITIQLTDEEAKALGQLSNGTDLPQDRVMIQALRLYQLHRAEVDDPGKVQIDTEVIDRLYLELSQFTRAKTNREIELEQLVRSAEQRPIPESHPRTADGVPIFIGGSIWAFDPDYDDAEPHHLGVVSICDESLHRNAGHCTISVGDDGWEFGNLEVWSTEAAAVASQSKNGGGGIQSSGTED